MSDIAFIFGGIKFDMHSSDCTNNLDVAESQSDTEALKIACSSKPIYLHFVSAPQSGLCVVVCKAFRSEGATHAKHFDLRNGYRIGSGMTEEMDTGSSPV
jgi:hypothetical protein